MQVNDSELEEISDLIVSKLRSLITGEIVFPDALSEDGKSGYRPDPKSIIRVGARWSMSPGGFTQNSWDNLTFNLETTSDGIVIELRLNGAYTIARTLMPFSEGTIPRRLP